LQKGAALKLMTETIFVKHLRTKMLVALTLAGNLASEGTLVLVQKSLVHLDLPKRADQGAHVAA
jgi:hypothetical protein